MKTTKNFFSLLAGLPEETVLTRNELGTLRGGTNGLPIGEDEDIIIPPPGDDEDEEEEEEEEKENKTGCMY